MNIQWVLIDAIKNYDRSDEKAKSIICDENPFVMWKGLGIVASADARRVVSMTHVFSFRFKIVFKHCETESLKDLGHHGNLLSHTSVIATSLKVNPTQSS